MRTTKTGFTLIELLFAILIFLLMTMVLAPFVHMAKDRAGKVACANNLRRISLGLHAYAADNNELFPKELAALYPNYITDKLVLTCPVGRMNYRYSAGLTESSLQKEAIVEDIDGNHNHSGKNILRVNGSVEWVGK